ncbi:UDP-N-acetylenolpyruvoylglucosamine reductase, putative [Babesia caballi]|uniref:UDP-N-acetylenolpyruvoylglucosamine reductase, putative n=1 Tax=Babesia caballi TaxID=5871 RepID=A0AAV4M4R7_BABCB|nr:UDP-N-acetylenolpyruvoylglucosamine reductase, putative [Babesia caballi]
MAQWPQTPCVGPPPDNPSGITRFEQYADAWRPIPTVMELVGVIWQLKLLLADTFMKDGVFPLFISKRFSDGTFSPTWLRSATEMQLVCEDYLCDSPAPSASAMGEPTVIQELKCGSEILDFIKLSRTRNCHHFMHHYSLLAYRFANCVINFATADIMRRRSAAASSDVARVPPQFAMAQPYEYPAYDAVTGAFVGCRPPEWQYPENIRHGALDNIDVYAQPNLFSHATAPIPPMPYQRVMPTPQQELQAQHNRHQIMAAYAQNAINHSERTPMPRRHFNHYPADMQSTVTPSTSSHTRGQTMTSTTHCSFDDRNAAAMPTNVEDSMRPSVTGPWDAYQDPLPEGSGYGYPASSETGTP